MADTRMLANHFTLDDRQVCVCIKTLWDGDILKAWKALTLPSTQYSTMNEDGRWSGRAVTPPDVERDGVPMTKDQASKRFPHLPIHLYIEAKSGG